MSELAPATHLENVILLTRGQKVLLDADLADLYGVETKALVRAVKRNAERFPADFMFQLSPEEVVRLRCQIGTSKSAGMPTTFCGCGTESPKNAPTPATT